MSHRFEWRRLIWSRRLLGAWHTVSTGNGPFWIACTLGGLAVGALFSTMPGNASRSPRHDIERSLAAIRAIQPPPPSYDDLKKTLDALEAMRAAHLIPIPDPDAQRACVAPAWMWELEETSPGVFVPMGPAFPESVSDAGREGEQRLD